jgi:IS5 family transposase
MRDTSRAAAKLAACLTSLRDNGLNIEELLPSEETIRQDDEEGGGLEYGGGYEDARFFIHMKLRHWLAQEQRDEITEYVLRVILGDPAATLGILTRITQAAGTYKVRRHHLSGRQRFAYLMARHMVRDSERLFGGPRYERAEAFAKAASGVQVKGLRQMMEREKKMAAIKARKARGASLRGN